jgi:hypothetical protein
VLQGLEIRMQRKHNSKKKKRRMTKEMKRGCIDAG